MASTVTFSFSIFFLVIFSSLNVPIISQGQEEENHHVLVLDHSNFSQTLTKHGFIVVKFYAPWCGACVRIAPEYEKAASILSTHDPEIVLAKIDVTDDANKKLAEEFEIQGVPTIKIFRNNGKENRDYKGPRKAEGIAKHLIKQLGPASIEVKSVEDADSLIDGNGISIVGIFPKFSGEEFDNFLALAEKLRSDYSFGHTLDAKFLSDGDKSVTGPILRLLKPFDGRFVDSQDFQVEAMEKFIEEGTIPDVTIYNTEPMNQAMISKFWQNSNSKVMLFTNFTSELHPALESKYREAAVEHKGKGLSMLIVDFETSGRLAEYFTLKGVDTPLILIEESNGKKKYIKENIKPDQILNSLKEYKDGVLKPFIKSQPIPEVNDEPVKVVVANSFEEIVLNSKKNVLVEFYAPRCEYCEKLAPILEEVAITYKNDPEILIAKMDATANDVTNDNFKVRGYPTVYLKSSTGDVLQYLEDHDKEEIIEFIEANREKIEQSTASSDSEEDDSVKDEL